MHKIDAMKTLPLRALAAAFAIIIPSCQLLEQPLSTGHKRDDYRQVPPKEDHQPDTVLLVTALCFPESYDWRLDSLFGQVQCTLKLYRGAEEALSLPAGPGTDISSSPDTYHIIDGSLYTECFNGTETVVCRNGERLACWKGKELLCGLVVKDGVLHTLGCGGGSLVYRRNGAEVLKVDGAVPYGGFRTDTYGPTGAIYESSDSVCFAFRTQHEEVFAVVEGEPRAVFSNTYARVLDVKLIDGAAVVLYFRDGVLYYDSGAGGRRIFGKEGVGWDYAALVMLGGDTASAGRLRCTGEIETDYGVAFDRRLRYLGSDTQFVYFGPDGYVPVSKGVEIPPDCYFLSRDCACLLPSGALAVALTPRDTESAPYVLVGGKVQEYPVYGLLASVSYQIVK